MGDFCARLRAVLHKIRNTLRRRRVELQGTDPYTWRRLIRRVRLGPSAKLVACMLADYANPDGTSVRPGNDRLAAVSELSDKTVRRSLVMLREMGLIERVFAGSKMGRRGLADEYRLTYPLDLTVSAELLPPDELPGSPVLLTGDTAPNPVDNPGSPVTSTGDPEPPGPVDNPGTPVTDAGTPVTSSRNTGHGDRPPNQAPNQLTPTNKPSGRADHVAEVEGAPASSGDPGQNDHQRGGGERRIGQFTYQSASAYLLTIGDAVRDAAVAQATAELGTVEREQLVIHAATLARKGIPA
jgi:hypothetical protein